MPEIPAVYCEVKLHGFRRTADGVVVSFVVHPSEVPRELALDPLGTRYMLALAEIGDDEQPIDSELRGDSQRSRLPIVKASAEPRPGVEPSSPTARAGASEMAKERYAASGPMEQAKVRACRLHKDERFRGWVASQVGLENVAIEWERAIGFIREHCGGSRSFIATQPEAYRKFLALETMFKIAVGEIAEPR